MAQLVEQRIRNAQVVGSSPTISSKKALALQVLFLLRHSGMFEKFLQY